MSAKKFPISQKVRIDLFGKTFTNANDVFDVFVHKYYEYILGRTAFIIRTVSPDTQRVDTPGLEVHGVPVNSIERHGDRIVLNSPDPRTQDVPEDFAEDGDAIFHVCHYLEERFVSPAARFCPNDPVVDWDLDGDEEDDQGAGGVNGNIPEGLFHIAEQVCDSALSGTPDEVIDAILCGAKALIAASDNPRRCLRDFISETEEVIEQVERENGLVSEPPRAKNHSKKILS